MNIASLTIDILLLILKQATQQASDPIITRDQGQRRTLHRRKFQFSAS